MNAAAEIMTPTAGMSREEWLAERHKGIGGSDAAAVLGLSPWRSPVDIWLDKTGRAAPKEETEAMRIGTELEGFVARRYCKEKGREVRRHNFMLRRGCLLGDIDRLVVPVGAKEAAHQGKIRTDTILECKTTSMDWPDGVPAYYVAQVQHYMGLCPAEVVHADVAALFLTRKHFEVFRIERNEEDIADMFAVLADWWARYVETDTPPPPRDEADCKALWARSKSGKSVDADEAARQLVADYAAAAKAAKEAEDTAAQIKDALCAFMGDAEILADPATGKPLVTWKSGKETSRTDWKAVAAALAPSAELIAMHTASAPGARRFLLK